MANVRTGKLDNDFYDFDIDILKNLLNRGYQGHELIREFQIQKKKLPIIMDSLIKNAEEEASQNNPLTKKEFKNKIGLL